MSLLVFGCTHNFVLQQKSLVYISVADQDIWLPNLYGLERCSSRLEGETIY